MQNSEIRNRLLASATTLFAAGGLHGVTVRQIAEAADVTPSMISYYFGGKDGLYTAVLSEQFASMNFIAHIASLNITPLDKFKSYICQCGICFHEGEISGFSPTTVSADPMAPECPRCLNNDTASFVQVTGEAQSADTADDESCSRVYKEIVGG
jgi:AcrR family transcriptional regulator